MLGSAINNYMTEKHGRGENKNMFVAVFESNHGKEMLPLGSKEIGCVDGKFRHTVEIFARDLDHAFALLVQYLSVFPVRLIEVAEKGKAFYV